MTKLFEERERTAELLFVRSEEAQFMAYCQGVRSLAVYAMGQIGVDRHSAEAYAQELLSDLVHGMKREALVERVRADLNANGVTVSPAELRRELDRCAAQSIYATNPAASRASSASNISNVP